jgi:CBS domain-containing protein
MRWARADVSFRLVDEDTSDPVTTIEVTTPHGALLIMGEPRESGRILIAAGVHISSRGVKPNDIGIANLRLIAQAIMEELDYDEIHVEGEVRTTGAKPGRRPRPLRFARSRGSETAPRYAPRQND